MLERRQPLLRHTLVDYVANGPNLVPILKYSLFVGASLLAIIVAAGQFTNSTPAAGPKQFASSSIELLRKTANHGELRPFASAAAAGPFLAMPAVTIPTIVAAAPVLPETVTLPPAVTTSPSALDAQARVDEPKVADKPARSAKKVASRKQKPRYAYVDNIPQQSSGFFGTFQSW